MLDAGLDGGFDTFCKIVYTLCNLLQRGRKDGVEFTKISKLAGHILRDLVQSGGEFCCEGVDIRWIPFSLRHYSSSQEVVVVVVVDVVVPNIYPVFLPPLHSSFSSVSSVPSCSVSSSSPTCPSGVKLVVEQRVLFLCAVNVPTNDSHPHRPFSLAFSGTVGLDDTHDQAQFEADWPQKRLSLNAATSSQQDARVPSEDMGLTRRSSRPFPPHSLIRPPVPSSSPFLL